MTRSKEILDRVKMHVDNDMIKLVNRNTCLRNMNDKIFHVLSFLENNINDDGYITNWEGFKLKLKSILKELREHEKSTGL